MQMRKIVMFVLIAMVFQVVSPITAWAATKFSVIYWSSGKISGQVYSNGPISLLLDDGEDVLPYLDVRTSNNVTINDYNDYYYYTEFDGFVDSEMQMSSITVYDEVYQRIPFSTSKGLFDDYSDEKYYIYDNFEPTVPTELTVVDSGLDSIEISWASSVDNISVRGYEVYANGELLALVTDQRGEEYQSYNLENLDYAEEYKIFVRAYDFNYNRSEWSEPLYAYLEDNVPPSVPESLEAMKKTDNQITLSWYASEDNVGVEGYEIYVDGELYDDISPSGNDIEIFTLKNLKTYKLYKINVRAYDEAANYSDMSNLLQVRTTDSIAPTVPTSLKVDNQKLNSFRLKWNCSRDNVGIKNYIIEHNQKVIATTTSPECMVNVTKAVPGTTYQLTVRAVDLAGNKSAVSTKLSYKFTVAFSVKNNKLHLNQDVINLGNGIAPRKISKNDYLVPIKAVYQSLGYTVTADTKKKIVVVTKAGSPTIQFSTDSKSAGTAKVNGTPVKLSSPVTTVNGVTMAPLSFIAKSAGISVQP